MTETAADRRAAAVAHSPAAHSSLPGPRNPLCTIVFCLVIPSSHLFLSPSRCILRSCVIRPHAHPWPGTPAGPGALRHIFRRCPPGCAHASGLLLTPPRAMRCEPALCGSMIASSRQTGHLGTVSVAMASSRHPSPRPRCLPHSGTRIPCPPSGLRPPPLRAYIHCNSQAFRPSEILCRCAAPVLLFSLLHSAAARPCPAPILQSPIRRSSHVASRPLRLSSDAGRRAGSVNSGQNFLSEKNHK